jgi:phospholipase D1/2
MQALLGVIEAARGNSWLPLVVVGVYVVWGAIFVSPWLLTLTVSTMVAPPMSTLSCWLGLNLSAAVYYGLGRLLARRLFSKLVGRRAKHLVEQAGFEGIVFIRVLPLFPYTLINLSAGAFGVPFVSYQLATAIGLVPLVLLVTLLGDRAVDVLKSPTPTSIALLALFVLLVVLLTIGGRKLMKSRLGNRLERNVKSPVDPP